MISEKSKLYALLIFACSAGYIWLIVTYHTTVYSANSNVEVCLIKHVTGVPCPSCGATRAVLSIFDGNLTEAIKWNPLGFIIVAILFICPLWIFYDTIRKTATFFAFYKQAELFLKRKWITATAICLVMGNWIWNIFKGL